MIIIRDEQYRPRVETKIIIFVLLRNLPKIHLCFSRKFLTKIAKIFKETRKYCIFIKLVSTLTFRFLEKDFFLLFVYLFFNFDQPCVDSHGQPGQDRQYGIVRTGHLAQGTKDKTDRTGQWEQYNNTGQRGQKSWWQDAGTGQLGRRKPGQDSRRWQLG
jgi:hypothetical protein